MRRAVEIYGDARYERLAAISVGHLYNLHQRAAMWPSGSTGLRQIIASATTEAYIWTIQKA
ncbi:hypothetical protein CCP3SC15_370021 [Gammaproteobacteria bacterium]